MSEFKNPSEMTDEEKKQERERLRKRLKELNASPRSDWYREFERILREEAKPYGKDVQIKIEEELGIDPPRIDYIILDDLKRLMRGKAIFRIFCQHNILEYKNPHDALNMRVISKVIGYANFYIGLAEYEADRPRNEVSISIFREKRNEDLFAKMMADGTLEITDVSGIYLVKRLTELPFQIVITGELKGEEYAAYRLLSEHADEKDMEIVADKIRNALTTEEQANGQRFMEFVEKKNPGILRKAIGGDKDMSSILMEVLKPEIDEKVNAAVTTAVNAAVTNARADERVQTTRINLYGYVQDGAMAVDYAANSIGMTVDQFLAEMSNHGYKVPQTV